MTRERFFIEQSPAGHETVRLDGEEAHHLRDVRRVKLGDEVVLFDGSGTDYVGRVERFDRAGASVRIVAAERPETEPDVAVTLAVSVIKQAAMDQLVDMCTQLGVKRLIPMQTAR